MSLPFYFVYAGLVRLSDWTGLTYEEVNIIVYYVIIPFFFFALIDKILKRPVCLILFSLVLLVAFFLIGDFQIFSEKLFDYSVVFLESFSKIGMGYDSASVVICVLLPFLFAFYLLCLAFPDFGKKYLPTLDRLIRYRRGKKSTGSQGTSCCVSKGLR